jgi:hypothetical protein
VPLYGACNADAYDRYGSRLIYVLAGDEKAVARLLDGQGAFHEMREHVAVVRAEELLKLRDALRLDGARRLLKWLELVR